MTGGILLPITQWLVLRRWVSKLPKTGWWVLVTYVGIITPGNFFVLEILQWLLLRKWVPQYQNWIWVNGIGGLAAVIFGFAVGGDGSDSGLVFIGFALSIMVFSLITGLLQNPISKS